MDRMIPKGTEVELTIVADENRNIRVSGYIPDFDFIIPEETLRSEAKVDLEERMNTVDTKMKQSEVSIQDYREDLVVIVAGYVDEMKKFINMNPGLRSRFNKYINFANYSAEEMLDIFRRQCGKSQFILSEEAEKAALEYFTINQNDSTFGNARGVRNFFDRVVTVQASRILTMSNPSETEFRTIKGEDIQ